MWYRSVTKNQVDGIPVLIEGMKNEVSWWGVLSDIRSEASLELRKEGGLTIFKGPDTSAGSDGLDFWFSLRGESLTIRYRKDVGVLFRHFLGFIARDHPADVNVIQSLGFKIPGSAGNRLSMSLASCPKDIVSITINMPSEDCALWTRAELTDQINASGAFEEQPVPGRGSNETRPVGMFPSSNVLDVATTIVDRVIGPGIGIRSTTSLSFIQKDTNRNAVNAWLPTLVDFDFGVPLKWEIALMLMDGTPPLGHENDGLLALCDKLIYIGSYDEGEGVVHVSLLEKRGGARHLALDSKYSLLKSQMPPSLRRLEWKRG